MMWPLLFGAHLKPVRPRDWVKVLRHQIILQSSYFIYLLLHKLYLLQKGFFEI